MNETTQIRLVNRASLIRQRKRSGLIFKQWREENSMSQNQYYYRLRRLRKAALEVLPSAKASTQETDEVQFVRIPTQTECSGDVALRIHRGETTIEVSNGVSDGIMTLLKEVMPHVGGFFNNRGILPVKAPCPLWCSTTGVIKSSRRG